MNVDIEVKRGKKFQTRDGRAVRIFSTDMKNKDHPIVGVILVSEGQERLATWTPDGYFASSNERHDDDLAIAKEVFYTIFDPYGDVVARYEQEDRAKEEVVRMNNKNGPNHQLVKCEVVR